jgi:hypothetical protein
MTKNQSADLADALHNEREARKIAGADAHLEANGHRWQADAALDGLDEFHPDTTHNPSGDAA